MSTQPKLNPRQQQQFAQMLPMIERTARAAFRHHHPDTREELVAEVVAAALVMFAALAQQRRESIAYATPLARYGVARVRDGRRTGSQMNINDVGSRSCQQRHMIKLERLDRRRRDEEGWREIVVEDKNAGPAEIAAVQGLNAPSMQTAGEEVRLLNADFREHAVTMSLLPASRIPLSFTMANNIHKGCLC